VPHKENLFWVVKDAEDRVVEDVENRVKVEKVEDVENRAKVEDVERAEEADVENHVKAEDVERAENRVEVVEEVEEDADVKLFYNI
jgi:predicted peptidase